MPDVATGNQIPIDVPNAAKREDVSFTGKRKRVDGESKKKAIMP